MTFIWILGNGSKWNNNEIRYSMRSVFKFHPDARMVIVGECPEWYTGEHHYIPDSDKCPYVNVWRKLEFACTLADEFVYMDDDFFLLEPFDVVHYYNTRSLDAMRKKYMRSSGDWPDVVKSTVNATPGAKNHMLHVPLPINSANFIRIASDYPERFEAPSLVPRQIYCANETKFKKIERQDVKVMYGFVKQLKNRIIGWPFFSTDDSFRSTLFKDYMDTLYSTPTAHEKDYCETT